MGQANRVGPLGTISAIILALHLGLCWIIPTMVNPSTSPKLGLTSSIVRGRDPHLEIYHQHATHTSIAGIPSSIDIDGPGA
mmetsp:Transcript_17975/g.37276  ORF Transcript_17975/g.37276 Transcript_17975/m.37276 type:complete len:81 (+) Transcript_17975:3453-3695(+)